MEVLYPRCAGLDVHAGQVTACVRVADGPTVSYHHRTVATNTRDLLLLAEWLTGYACTHVAMEATGVYWKPIWNLLEGEFERVLVNARRVKNAPGRKTDVKDCQWLAHLLACGLLRGSFVPRRPQRELRELTRHRAQLVGERARAANRIEKTLEDANIQLGAVVSHLLGVSSRDMLRRLARGETDARSLAELARSKLRGKIPQPRQALEGRLTERHRFMLERLPDHLECVEGQIDRFEALSRPFEQSPAALAQIPGVAERAAQNIASEIGIDMSPFPTERRLASWVGLSPGNNESAGKRKSGRTTKGNRRLRGTLVQCAWAATRRKGSYFQAPYRRLAPRRGKKRALVAVAHSLLTVIWHILKHGVERQDLGADCFDRQKGEQLLRHHVKRIADLGHDATLHQRAA